MAMLTPQQIEHFKARGFVVVPGLIEPVYLDAWRRQFWEHIGADPKDRSTWKEKPYVVGGYSVKPDELRFDRHPGVCSIIDQLGGGNFGGGGGQALVHWPQETTAWESTPWGHLDGYYPGSWDPFMVACTACAYDTEPMGGAFQYWPGSHLTTHRYFLENPDQVDGRFRDVPGFNWGDSNVFTRIAPEPPAHFNGNAGDVIFWHAYMVHTGSANIRSLPRIGFFNRYSHKDQKSFRHEIPENLWKYWAI